MSLEFEWDARKEALNRATAFGDPRSLAVPDPEHSLEESRFVLLGLSYLGRLLVVVHTERGDNLRIISARKATKRERRQYGEVQSDKANGMQKEYDFSGGVRGKYATRYAQGCNVVVLEPDVARSCPDAEAVNRALRALAEVAPRASRRKKSE